MNKFDHSGTTNIDNKTQDNDAIENGPKFDNKLSLPSGPNKDP